MRRTFLTLVGALILPFTVLGATPQPSPTPVPPPADKPAPQPSPRTAPQTPDTPVVAPTPPPAPTEPPFTIVYKDGLFGSTADGQFTFRLDGSIQADGRFFDTRPDTFSIRRGQFGVAATLFKYTEFRFEAELSTIDRAAAFSNSRVALENAYVGLLLRPEIKLRAGLFKVPFESEFGFTSDRYIDFVERSWVRRVSPIRDEGVMIYGELWKRLDYQAGVFDGAMNDSGSKNAFDTNDMKDLALQLRLRPFSASSRTLLKGLHVGGGYTVGGARGDPIGSISSQETELTVLRLESGISGGARRTRRAIEAYWLAGPMGLKAEYARMDADLVRGGQAAELDLAAYFVSVTYVVTGEQKTAGLLRPRHNFDKARKTWGSLEVGARVSGLHADGSMFAGSAVTRLADPAQSAEDTRTITAGLTWRLNPAARMMVNYVRDRYDRPLRRTFAGAFDAAAHAWLIRLQADF